MPDDPKPPATAQYVWSMLRRDIQTVALREPELEPLLTRTVLEADQFNTALARCLARGLASPDLTEAKSEALMTGVFRAQPDLIAAAARDLDAIRDRDPASRSHANAFLNARGFHALQAYRVAHTLWDQGRVDLAAWLSTRAASAFGPDIHPAARLGAGIVLDHGAGIVIGETAVVEDDVTILQNVTLGGTGKTRGDRHPKVRQGVMIGAGANIIGNIELGAFSKIAAGSVVLKDVPPRCTVAGIPAQIVRLHHRSQVPANAPTHSWIC